MIIQQRGLGLVQAIPVPVIAGRITQIAVPVRVNPIEAAASVMPRGITRMAARKDSVR